MSRKDNMPPDEGVREEEDESFPDEEEAEAAEEEAVEFPELPEKERIPFIDDPWPTIVFVLMVIGFAFVLFSPPAAWAAWSWTFVSAYFLVILVAAGSTLGYLIWKKYPGKNLRFGGITNLIVMLVCGMLGVVDAASQVLTGHGLFPALGNSLMSICTLIVVMCMYSIWLIQRTLTKG